MMTKNELTLRFAWTHLGEISLDGGGHLEFPRAPLGPGLYCFEIAGTDAPVFYIGQTDNLARRFQNYRTPGRSQQTNIRLNGLMAKALQNGGRISVATMTDNADLVINGDIRAVALDAKTERILLEHAAIAMRTNRGIETLNR